MPDQSAIANIVAGSLASANPNAEYRAQVAATGTATVAGSMLANYKATLAILGSGSVLSSPTATYRVRDLIRAGSTFTTWRIFLEGGYLAGVGELAGDSVLVRYASGTLEGSGDIAASPVQTVILGAQVTGAGTLSDDLTITAAGSLSGAGAISATAAMILGARPLPMVGVGGMHDSLPLPMVGSGFLTGYADVFRLPRPICPPRIEKSFRYGYVLGKGDLELRVCDASGNAFAPVVVLYAFYQIVAGGQRMLVGPPNRRPAPDLSGGKVGRYYATGTAGELGQPGEWVIVWRYQRSWWTPTECFEQGFRVYDEVSSGDPGALAGRCRKYGWL